MSWRQDTMMNPAIEELLGRVDSKFTLVTLAARRARQVNSYYNQLGEGLGSLVPPQVTSSARKPLSISFEEVAADKITYTRLAEDTDEAALALADETERELGPVGTLSEGDPEG
jgi:DNA-directed RNA polymerase subunit omega